MNITFRFFLSTILVLLLNSAAPSQVLLNRFENAISIDFEATIPGVCEAGYEGSGFSPIPLPGQLNSGAWEILGFSDGDLFFGGTAGSGDLARGTTNGTGTSTGGLYSLTNFPPGGGRSMAFQPGGTDFTPGTITLRIVNGDVAETITQLALSYDIYERNDADRSTYINFSYSHDNLNFIPLAKLGHNTGEVADALPQFVKIGGPGPTRSAVIPSTSVGPNGGEFYLRWSTDDNSGTGSRDEIALDNITVSATFLGTTAASGSIEGRAISNTGSPLRFVRIALAGSYGSPVRYALTNQFGRFVFHDVALGESYVLRASSRKYVFTDPVLIVSALDEVTSVVFIGGTLEWP